VAAGSNLQTGSQNTLVGVDTMGDYRSLTTAQDLVVVGYQALYRNYGSGHVVLGSGAMDRTSGSNNVAIGFQSGTRTGSAGGYNSNSLYLGPLSGPSGDGDNQIALGAGAACSTANQMVVGGSGSDATHPALTQVIPGRDNAASLGGASNRWTVVYAANGIIQTSDQRVKDAVRPLDQGLAALMRLQPKLYFKHESHFQDGSLVLEAAGREEAGFFAQEVAEILPTAVQRPEDELKALWGMNYEQVLPYAVKAVQELAAANGAQQARLEALEKRVADLLQLLAAR
jgi:hypothetical protein